MMLTVAGKMGFATMGFFPRRAMVCPSSTASIPGKFSKSGWEHRAGLLLINGFSL